MGPITSHETTTELRRSGGAGMLLAICLVGVVAWAALAVATRGDAGTEKEEGSAVADGMVDAPAGPASTVALPRPAALDDTAIRHYWTSLSALTPDLVGPAYAAGLADTARRRYGAAFASVAPQVPAPDSGTRFDGAARRG